MPDKPFFTYFAPGATHAPHHVPKEWADKYKANSIRGGKAARGNFRPAKEARRHSRGLRTDARHPEIPAWDTITPDDEAGARAPDGGLCGFSWSTPIITSGR